VVRTNLDKTEESYRVKVPIQYGPKEKYLARIRQDPNLSNELQVTLPQMSFVAGSPTYDSGRKLQTMNRLSSLGSSGDPSKLGTIYNLTPWDIPFTLSIFARNIDDAYQVVEQILPYFTPDYTVKVNLVPELNIVKEFPLVLNGVTDNTVSEGSFEDVRVVEMELTFNMKAAFAGPVANTPTIQTVTVNFFDAHGIFDEFSVMEMYANTGTGTYRTGDIVYQGRNINEAYGTGTVIEWNPAILHLRVANVTGYFSSNVVVKGATSNGNYIVLSSEIVPTPLAKLIITPIPPTANANSIIGISVVTTEYPNL